MKEQTIGQMTQELLDKKIAEEGLDAPSVKMLQRQLDNLRNPRSVETIFRSSPLVNRKGK